MIEEEKQPRYNFRENLFKEIFMKHYGGCHCGNFKFETNLDPMFVIQCNCSICRRISGSIALHCAYGETEIEISGETNSYSFKGGSGYETTAHSCKKCYTRVYNIPAAEVMEGIISLPLGVFDTAKNLTPKVEIWTEDKLPFIKNADSILESFEGNAITERLTNLLESMGNR